jgi:hypothetical protein
MAQSTAYLLSERARLLADISRVNAQLEYARVNSNPAIVFELEQRLASSQELLAVVNEQLQTAQEESAISTASAGEYVAQAQTARDDSASTQNPSSPVTVFSSDGRITQNSIFTQDQINQNLETGTDAPTRTLIQTQSTPPLTLTIINDDDGNPLPPTSIAAVPTQTAGVGAGNDDSGQPTKNSTRSDIDGTFNNSKIIPQDNLLDQYASYTYTASLYLMSPDAYKQFLQQKQRTIPSNQLLIQSGGAPTAGRNPYFQNDYYIDRIELKSVITGKGTNAAHNVFGVKLSIIEPNGITLISNLDKAVQAYLGSANKKKTNFTAPIYLLVIRFYGYDDAGNLVRGGVARPQGSSDGSAFVEKFYPITISKIDFKVANKAVEYEIEGAAVSTQIAASSNRGTIPYNVEIGGLTVKDALTGPAKVVPTSSTTSGKIAEQEERASANADADAQEGGFYGNPPPAPPTANAAPNPKLTVRQGLMTALNQYQEDLVKRGIYTVPDTYSIEFVNSSIEQAKIQVKNPDKNKGAMPVAKTASDQKNPAKQSYDPTSRIISVTAGYQIVQFIDQVIRNSSYITDQALVKISEQNGKQESNGKPGDNIAWYKITMQATPKKYDPKRNDYAYDIKYIVHAYRLNNLISNYFQVPKYNGVHKQYNYWFTGENSQVLSYEQTYNALYTSVLSGGPGQLGGSVVNDAIKANFQPTSGESNQGAAGRVNEIGANAADYLYNPADLANATLQIIGDPAWLQQGEVLSVSKNNFSFNPFLADGSINFESQQILFEILINTPSDYDLNTGIIDPNVRETVFQNQKRPGATRQSYVYQATECTSEFRQGKFTQQLKGILLSYLPDQTFKDQQALGRPASTTSNGQPRTTNNPSVDTDNEWTDQDGLNVLAEDLPTFDSDNAPLSEPEPLPADFPEPATSDGDIVAYEEQDDPFGAGVNIDSQYMAKEA